MDLPSKYAKTPIDPGMNKEVWKTWGMWRRVDDFPPEKEMLLLENDRTLAFVWGFYCAGGFYTFDNKGLAQEVKYVTHYMRIYWDGFKP